MAKVYSKALDQTLEVDRIIGHIKGSLPGPTLIFTAGIHGNEPSGIFALKQVLDEIQENDIELRGNIYALSGNLWALERGERFHKKDLNRIWSVDRMRELDADNPSVQNEDEAQQLDIHKALQEILETNSGPFYFIDLHTTSSATIPFITVNDSLLNRKFTDQYPVPKVLGIEEYLDGPLLSLINELGYVAFGYEAGQHDDHRSIENHKAFVYLSLVFTNSCAKETIDFDHYYRLLSQTSKGLPDIFEIYYRHEVKEEDNFVMKPGFSNFQLVKKGQELAQNNGTAIQATHTARVFMPLYQSQGNDGFFAIRRIHPIFLKLSSFIRKVRLDNLLALLPGISWSSEQRQELKVNRRVARFFTKQFLHLMGYRSKRLDSTHLTAKNREAASRNGDYEKEHWY